jgi:hypothetical protein
LLRLTVWGLAELDGGESGAEREGSARARLEQVPLERFFPEYTGGADINKAPKYLLNIVCMDARCVALVWF